MARASTADASAQAGAWQTFAFFRTIATLPHNQYEPLVRRALSAIFIVFVLVLVAASIGLAFEEQERIVGAATIGVDAAATMLADDIDIRVQTGLDASPTVALAHVIPQRQLIRGQRILVTDTAGKVIASYPDPHVTGSLSDHLGNAQPLTTFGDKAGVMQINLPSGLDALATVRSLHEPLGQIAVIHPMRDVLSEWHSAVFRIGALLFCTATVLTAFAGAYFWQAARARQAHFSCRRMRDRVDLVLSRGHCGLWDWHLGSGRVDWSLSMYEILGMMPRAHLAIADVDALLHPADRDATRTMAYAQGTAPQAIDHVFRMRHAQGHWVWLRAKAELVHDEALGPHLVGIAFDITENMALEERTAKADMRLRDAIETISEAFVVWDAENRLVMCNSKFQRFYDLPDDAVQPGTPYATVMERGTPPVVQAQVPVARPQPMGARTFEAQLGDGRWLQIDERRTKDGGYVSVGTDITALKRNEEQLLESERRLMHSVMDLRKSRQELERQAQALAELAEKYLEQKAAAENANRAKSDFLANMGHELRTPLNAILGFSEVMMMESYGCLGSPLYKDYCKGIHSSGQYLLNVIADVLEMSRLEAGRVHLDRGDFFVREPIEVAMASVAKAADANKLTIFADVEPSLRMFADRTALEKVLTILLNNSVKFTPENGSVRVRVRSAGDALNIYVADSGVGITPEAIAKLGSPFEQSEKILRDGMRGSGLGLAIARSLIDLHGGRMSIKSQPGLGTLVLVHLPRTTPSRPHLTVAATSPRFPTRAGRYPAQLLDKSTKKVSRTA